MTARLEGTPNSWFKVEQGEFFFGAQLGQHSGVPSVGICVDDLHEELGNPPTAWFDAARLDEIIVGLQRLRGVISA